MKKLQYSVLGIAFLFSTVHAISLPTENTKVETSRGFFRVLVSAVGEWQSLKEQETAKKVSLAYEENLNFPSLKEIERLNKEIDEKEHDLEVLQNQYMQLDEENEEKVFLESIRTTQAELENLKIERKNYETTYNTRKEKQQSNLKLLKEDLESLREDIEKQKELIRTHVSRSAINIFFIVGIIILLLGLRFISSRIILRFFSDQTSKRQTMLLNLNRIIFNLIIAFVVLGIISSQFISLLPFLALIGTGVAFAIRDVLSSFIGWFVIGTDRGYKVGHIIQVGKAYGVVQEIGPFLTVLRDLNDGYETGKTITFPNKVVFEEEVINLSKCSSFVQHEISFLITENSDIKTAQSTLLDLIQKEIDHLNKEQQKTSNKFLRCNLSEEDQKTFVWIDISEHGIVLNGRFLANNKEGFQIKRNLEEKFWYEAKHSDKFSFHFIDTGRNQKNTKKNKTDRDHDHFH